MVQFRSPIPSVMRRFKHLPHSNNLLFLRTKIEQDIDGPDDLSRFRLQKLSNAAEKAFAERSLLFDDNRLLFAQNNENVSRKSVRSTVVGTAKVMSYEDIVEARTNRDAKAAGRIPKRKSAPTAGQERGSRCQEVERAEEEIRTLGLANCCSVLHFDEARVATATLEWSQEWSRVAKPAVGGANGDWT